MREDVLRSDGGINDPLHDTSHRVDKFNGLDEVEKPERFNPSRTEDMKPRSPDRLCHRLMQDRNRVEIGPGHRDEDIVDRQTLPCPGRSLIDGQAFRLDNLLGPVIDAANVDIEKGPVTVRTALIDIGFRDLAECGHSPSRRKFAYAFRFHAARTSFNSFRSGSSASPNTRNAPNGPPFCLNGDSSRSSITISRLPAT
jgi:hypothetical protein